jgi:hypothetical protein
MAKAEARMEFVHKRRPINGVAPFARARWIASLHHEATNDAMENCIVVITLQAPARHM